MACTELILELPAELICEVLGKWLLLKDLPRLDSAFCHHSKRKALHQSVFQSPLFRCRVVPEENQEEEKELVSPEICIKWILAKGIRAECLTFSAASDLPIGLEYLQQFGSCVKGVSFEQCAPGESVIQVLHLCPNLRAIVYEQRNITGALITAFSECTKLDYLMVLSLDEDNYSDDRDSEDDGPESDEGTNELLLNLPTSPRLNLKTIFLACKKKKQTAILNICESECIHAMFLGYSNTLLDWSCYTSLRSVKLLRLPYGTTPLVPLLTQCSWITHLDASEVNEFSNEEFTTMVHSLRQIRTPNIQNADELTDVALQKLSEKHSHCLETLVVDKNSRFTSLGINSILKSCTNLRTISCGHTIGLDYSLMHDITTLDTDFPRHKDYKNVWRAIQQNCHSLQHLCLPIPLLDVAITNNIQFIVETTHVLLALRCVHIEDMRNCSREQLGHAHVTMRPGVRLVEEGFYECSSFFKMPF